METSTPVTGKVVSVQRCPGYRKPMQELAAAELLPNLGIKNDTHALPDSSRQILLLEKETLDALGLATGEIKENITTAGIQLMKLQHHDRLKIGADVVLEIMKACSPCSRMEAIRPGLRAELAGKRGMLARVLSGGVIRKGDSITIIKQ